MRSILTCLLLSSCAPALALAQEQGTPITIEVPADDSFDWIQLVSGEWLKGELLRLRDGTLEFDSDKLDNLNLDWDDILVVRSNRMQTILLEGQVVHEGTVYIRDGELLLGGEGGQVFQRDQLLAIVPGGAGEGNYWSGKLSAGLSLRRGNTSQTDYNAYAFARRETASTRWDNSYTGNFSRTNSVEVANNHRLATKFDYFLTKRFYLTPFSGDVYRDPFSNIDVRYSPAAGFGYDLVARNTLSWEVGAGPAYQYTRFDSVQAGEPSDNSTLAAYLLTGVEWDITPDTDLTFNYQITVPLPDSDEYNHHLSTVLSLDLYGDLDLNVTLTWDRINKPPLAEDGVEPKPNDFRLSVGLGWDF